MKNIPSLTDMAVIGAYLSEGFILARPPVEDHIGTISELCEYAPYIYALAEAGHAVIGEYPGVVEYEVVEPFGQWFGEYVSVNDSRIPNHSMAAEKLKLLMTRFFLRGSVLRAIDLRVALDAVSIGEGL